MHTTRRDFLRHVGLGSTLFGLGGFSSTLGFAAEPTGKSLPRSLPEAQGVSSPKLLEFLQAVETSKLNLHSFMLVRHGHVVAEGWWAPYSHNLRHTLYSLSKSFCSTGVGIAAAEGKLSLEDKVTSFFPEDLPANVSPNLAAMQVKHLLMMGAGHRGDSLFGEGFSVSEKN